MVVGHELGHVLKLPARDGQVQVVDFGIARLADVELTRAGVIMGTPSYLAPEVPLTNVTWGWVLA